jgi:hypothetical protein
VPGKATPQWRRSSYCADATCVEVAELDGDFLMRDSKNPEQQFLQFSQDAWRQFVEAVQRREF